MEEQRSANRGARSLMLLAGVDYFKDCNDCYGHPEGDVVLMGMARAAGGTLNRSHDLAFQT